MAKTAPSMLQPSLMINIIEPRCCFAYLLVALAGYPPSPYELTDRAGSILIAVPFACTGFGNYQLYTSLISCMLYCYIQASRPKISQ